MVTFCGGAGSSCRAKCQQPPWLCHFTEIFPDRRAVSEGRMDVPRQAVAHLANELGTSVSDFDDYSFSDRLLKFHRADIRAFLGFRAPTNEDATMAQQWLTKEA